MDSLPLPNPAISIHAPPRGATSKYFCPYRCRFISIHAPPRGATRPHENGLNHFQFQFTPLREGRHSRMFDNFSPFFLFQFTPLREGRRDENAFSPPDFISIHAPPRGATITRTPLNQRKHLFQFTPLREGRRATGTARLTLRLHFNSRPSARGDKASVFIVVVVHISIHAPPRGATTFASFEIHEFIFQFTPLREGRR